MKIKVEVKLTKKQEVLLKKILEADCYEDMLDEEENDLHILCKKGVAESILGEQFYITLIGKKYLKQKIRRKAGTAT